MATYIPKGWNYTNTTTNAVWKNWVNVGYSTGPMTFQYNDDTWQTWTSSGTTTTGNRIVMAYDPAYTWDRWEEAGQVYVRQEYYQAPAVRQPTQEELDAAQARREEASARALATRQRLEGAQDRALGLLRSLLTVDQVRTMEADQEIWVRGSDGGFYVIETDGRVHGNIRSVDEHGCMLGRLCVQPGMYDPAEGAALPTADGHVGQLLAIRHDEALLRATANWSGRRQCQQPDVPILRAA